MDPSGVILQPDGLWHLFPDAEHWGHCSSPDTLRWNCSHPGTNFSSGETGSITVTPAGTFAIYPNAQSKDPVWENETKQMRTVWMATPTGPDLDYWEHHGVVGLAPNGVQTDDPGRAIKLKSGWYLPQGGDALHWLRADNDSFTHLTYTGVLFQPNVSVPAVSSTTFACPDVFELDGKIVILLSTNDEIHNADGGSRGYVQWWIGEMSSDDLKFLPESTGRLDHGEAGISSIFAAKSGTSALPPFDRRVVFGFTGWSSCHLTSCKNRYLLPRELSLSNAADTKPLRLLQHPVRELEGLRRKAFRFPAIAHGSQAEILIQCGLPPAGVPTAGVLGVRTMLAAGKNQSVEVGYRFSAKAVTAFASVSESLSVLGARTDESPLLPAVTASMKQLELHVFVDGHMIDSFFGGDAVITTVTVSLRNHGIARST